jgi:hypothetical protein
LFAQVKTKVAFCQTNVASSRGLISTFPELQGNLCNRNFYCVNKTKLIAWRMSQL